MIAASESLGPVSLARGWDGAQQHRHLIDENCVQIHSGRDRPGKAEGFDPLISPQ